MLLTNPQASYTTPISQPPFLDPLEQFRFPRRRCRHRRRTRHRRRNSRQILGHILNARFRTARRPLPDRIFRHKLPIRHTPPHVESVVDLVQKLAVAFDGGVDAARLVQSGHNLVVGVGCAIGGVDVCGGEKLVERLATKEGVGGARCGWGRAVLRRY